jgi:ubiquinone/menaquinone biosynthesis C-methylase UbiE
MRIQDRGPSIISSDQEQIAAHVPFHAGERVLELGCGSATTTRVLAEAHPEVEIIATDVDRTQLDKNLRIDDLPNVSFRYGSAQEIALPDASVDVVVMLKSLHHVPQEYLPQSLAEVRRVLVPGGLAWISEPVFAGPFSEILRIFHDERVPRQAAFDAVRDAVATGMFQLVRQIFFDEMNRYRDFAEFEDDVIGVSHTHFDLDAEVLDRVREAFAARADRRGAVSLRAPQRVDLLRCPR